MNHATKRKLARKLQLRVERTSRSNTPLFSGLAWSSRRAQRENPKPLDFKPLKVGKVKPAKPKVLKAYKVALLEKRAAKP